MLPRSLPPQIRARGVTAILGPTNTGKTHYAIERMLAHDSGMIGLPLRLLAREVYGRVVEKVGASKVALVTGEEKIKPKNPRYWISTVEAMPRDLDLAFVAIDEIQLASDLDRGHVFTDRLLNQRGLDETLLIGSSIMRPLIERLIPGVHVVTRPRLSQLSFAGEKKVSRLPPRTAIVAFSAEEVYAVAELIRRQRGGAAVVLGALSPRTRNAQVDLYQSGDVDYLVATDAIGMGLNLDVDHVAFAASRKFDGFRFRNLHPPEIGQIAGRAGRYLTDGTFGTTGRCDPFSSELVAQVENHMFDSARILQWRNPDLNFSSIAALQESLAEQPREHGLVRAPAGEDMASLDIVARDPELADFAKGPAAVERLWQVCQVPDYRKVSPASHADLVSTLYRFLMRDGTIPSDWFARQVASLDRMEGDIDTLSNRIAQIRTWTFVANRPDWLARPEHWQGATRAVEDKLSDALHERLAQRFIDRRTSVLMRRLRENAMLEADITATGDVTVEGQHVGHLHGFHFVPDPEADGAEAKALRAAASKALSGEIEGRADRFASAADSSLVLSNDGTIRWTGDPVAKLEPGEKLFSPRIRVIADEHLAGAAREKVEQRLEAWLKAHVVRVLGPVLALEDAQDLTGLARGIAFQVAESLGVLERSKVTQDMRSLDQDGRSALRQKGIRFGAYHIYLPALLKPAPRTLAAQLWALKHGGLDQKGLDEIAHLASSGRTSIPVDPDIAKGLYRAAGFRVCGARAVRVDILERLADLIRPAIAYRPGVTVGEPPQGAADGDAFVGTVGMTSLVGCSGEDFASILRSLGYVMERRAGPAITVALIAAAPMAPISAPAPAVSPEPVETGASEAEAPTEPVEEQVEAEAPAEPVEAAAVPVPEPSVNEAPDLAGGETGAELNAESASLADVPAAAEALAEEPAAEVPAAEAESATAPSPEQPSEPVEPVLIEVWRQHRHNREERRDHRGAGRPARPGAGRPDRRGDQAQRANGAGRPEGEPRRAEGGGGRPPRPQGARPQGERTEERGPRPEGQARPDRQGRPDRPPRPDRQGRPDRSDRPERNEGRRDERAFQARPREERREKQPDPDSPFAKLLALKEQLQNRDGSKR